MRRRALLVGINHYENASDLSWCVDDTLAMCQVLKYHENGDPNFACRVLLGLEQALNSNQVLDASNGPVTFNSLRSELEDLFSFDNLVPFYFSGHGYSTSNGVYLVSQDGTNMLPGILLNDILDMVNASPAREIFLVIDTCFSGAFAEQDQFRTIGNSFLRRRGHSVSLSQVGPIRN